MRKESKVLYQDSIHNVQFSEVSILDSLLSERCWEEYFDHKSRIIYNRNRVAAYQKRFNTDHFRRICSDIVFGRHQFSIPVRKEISKLQYGKKRVVYSFDQDEMLFLRGLSFILYKYDHLFSESLYSFRKGHGVKEAIRKLWHIVSKGDMYG